MNSFWRNPIVALLSSVKTAAILMAIFAFAIGYATFFENWYGRVGAYAVVYAARWFEIVLALFTISLILLFFKRMPYRPRQYGFMLVHLSMVVILIGAGMTRYLGYEGVMPIREGSSTDYILSDTEHVKATFGGETATYPVRLYRPGPQNEHKKITLGGQRFDLAVAEFWPHFEQKWVAGEGGPALLEYGAGESGGGIRMRSLLQGDHDLISGVDAHFHSGEMPPAAGDSRYGSLRMHAGGEVCRIAVELPPNAPHQCGGWTFQVTEFQSDFKVGGDSDPDGPLLNPMIRLQILDPEGQKGERVLFALHPEFAMHHEGMGEEFAQLDLLYEIDLGIEFATGGETGLLGRAAFELAEIDMADAENPLFIPAGETFPVHTQRLYTNEAQGFTLVPSSFEASVVKAPGMSDNERMPPAVRVVITDAQGESAEAIVRDGDSGEAVTLGGRVVTLGYGSIVKKLPYRLELADFVLDTYPGSDNPASYESWVKLYDEEQGIDGEEVRIYMNHPLLHRGSKHFQSSYDQDRRGTILSVNHDPGKWPTYIGYMLITLGFLLIMTRDLFWPRRRTTTAASGETETADGEERVTT